MAQPTLYQFIEGCLGNRFLFGRNSHVQVPGFDSVYVRYGRRYVNGQVYCNVLDLASGSATTPGSGCFRRMWRDLARDYPAVHLYVENVLTPRFQEFFRKEGLLEIPDMMTSSFFLRRG